jgi:hypothetical protein
MDVNDAGPGILGDLAWTTFLNGGSWYDAAHHEGITLTGIKE